MSCGFLGCINLLLGQGLNSNRHLLEGVGGGAPLSLKGEGGGGGGGHGPWVPMTPSSQNTQSHSEFYIAHPTHQITFSPPT